MREERCLCFSRAVAKWRLHFDGCQCLVGEVKLRGSDPEWNLPEESMAVRDGSHL